MNKKTYTIDGNDFETFEEFCDVISRTLIPGAFWGRNLNAFNDILRGGFGTPDEGFIIHWKNAELCKQCLTQTFPISSDSGDVQTLYDVLLTIIRDHCPGGDQSEDGVELILD